MSKHKATQFQLEGEARFQVREGRVELPVRVDGAEQVVYFATQDCALRPSDEALVSTSLLPCMVAGCDYPRQLELDPQFIGALPLIQDMYRMWMPQLRMVEIPAQATPAAPATERGTKVGAFFSGGVDSFYTLLKHQEEITHVCFVHGMDILLDNVDFRLEVARRIRGMARDFGKEVIEIETNSRSILDSYVSWLIGLWVDPENDPDAAGWLREVLHTRRTLCWLHVSGWGPPTAGSTVEHPPADTGA